MSSCQGSIVELRFATHMCRTYTQVYGVARFALDPGVRRIMISCSVRVLRLPLGVSSARSCSRTIARLLGKLARNGCSNPYMGCGGLMAFLLLAVNLGLKNMAYGDVSIRPSCLFASCGSPLDLCCYIHGCPEDFVSVCIVWVKTLSAKTQPSGYPCTCVSPSLC